MKHCKDCLAYYSDDVEHTCPEWLKLLVMNKRTTSARKASAIFAKNKSVKPIKENVKKFDEMIKKNKKV